MVLGIADPEHLLDVLGELTEALLFGVLAVGDVANDREHLIVRQGEQPRLEGLLAAAERHRVFEGRDAGPLPEALEASRERFGDDAIVKTGHALADELLRRHREICARAAPHVEDASVGRHPDVEVGRGIEHGAQLGVGLHQLVGAEIERPLQHGAVLVELAIGAVDGIDEGPELRVGGRSLAAEMLSDLAPEQAVQPRAHQTSVNVVIVIVWLWRSQRAPGVNGDISP